MSQESCKSSKQTNANARVCLYDWQVSREIFPVFSSKDILTYILHLLNWPFLAFLTSENDVVLTVTLHHLFQFWRAMVRYYVRKELFARLKGIFRFGTYHFFHLKNY